jgi:hypothetical protein
MKLIEKNLVFDFDSSLSIQYDETKYYRERFQSISDNDISAVDFITIKNEQGYMIEVKDYRHSNSKFISYKELIPILIKKILSTLSSIIPMKLMAKDIDEKNIAQKFSEISQLTIICHIELPSRLSKQQMAFFRRDKIELELKRKLLPVYHNLYVVSTTSAISLPWTVKDINATP